MFVTQKNGTACLTLVTGFTPDIILQFLRRSRENPNQQTSLEEYG